MQQHVGELNAIVISLYNGDITAEEAQTKAKNIIDKTTASLAQ